MTLKKMVDGVEVEMAPEEEAAILAEWAANDPATRPSPPTRPTVHDVITVLKGKGALTEAEVVAAATARAAAAALNG